jgi:endo-1,4-beta-xylanase
MNRRSFVKLALAAGSVSATAPLLAHKLAEKVARGSASLRDIAARKGILFGSEVLKRELQDPSYEAMFGQQCAVLVPGHELKWDALRPTPDGFDFSSADWLYEFAKSQGLLFRGHTLVWEQALPSWFSWHVSSSNAEKILTEHISAVVGHYSGKATSWDVVNEAVWLQDGRSDGLKITPWIRFIGREYIEIAFRAAHEADPKATLVYNENGLELDDQIHENKRQAVLSLLTELKKRNVPVHGLGIQSHIFAEAQVTGVNFRRFLQEVEGIGLSILVTEMDVRDQHLPADLPTRDRMVADQYEKYLSFLLQFESVRTVLTWGLSDRDTWISNNNKRADGLPVRPLPYDANLKTTLSWDAMARAFEGASKR